MKNDDKTAITSYSDRCLDDGTMLIAHDLEILVLVVEQGIRLADLDGRVRVGFAAQLLEELVDVIVVDVAVAASEKAATRPPDAETTCNPDGSHGTPNPSRAQTNAINAAARVPNGSGHATHRPGWHGSQRASSSYSSSFNFLSPYPPDAGYRPLDPTC